MGPRTLNAPIWIGGAGRGGAPVGKGIARVDIGGGAHVTRHRQDASGPSPETKLTQTEIHGFAGASVLNVLFSVRGSGFSYDKEPKAQAAVPPARWTPVAGHVPYSNGYAKTSWHARMEWPMLPMVAPFAGYTFTSFKELPGGVRLGDARAISLGLSVGLELIAVEGSYQVINISGGSKSRNYVQVGATLRL